MPYASLADLVKRATERELLDVADRDNDGAPDPDVVEAALVHADNVANGFLAVRYRLPLAAVPDLLRTWCVAIARYYLHSENAPDNVVRDWKDANASLEKMARGLLDLPVVEGEPEPGSSDGGRVSIVGPDPVFTRENLEGFL